jgi:hypothetical protein
MWNWLDEWNYWRKHSITTRCNNCRCNCDYDDEQKDKAKGKNRHPTLRTAAHIEQDVEQARPQAPVAPSVSTARSENESSTNRLTTNSTITTATMSITSSPDPKERRPRLFGFFQKKKKQSNHRKKHSTITNSSSSPKTKAIISTTRTTTINNTLTSSKSTMITTKAAQQAAPTAAPPERRPVSQDLLFSNTLDFIEELEAFRKRLRAGLCNHGWPARRRNLPKLPMS